MCSGSVVGRYSLSYACFRIRIFLALSHARQIGRVDRETAGCQQTGANHKRAEKTIVSNVHRGARAGTDDENAESNKQNF